MSGSKKRLWARLVAFVALAGLGAIGFVGWKWLDGLVCSHVVVAGQRYAGEEEILAVARVDTGGRLLDVDPALIADRVERHPWVREARVRRLPPGTVAIRVVEREPVALATGRHGRADIYLDAEGFTMPAVPEAVFDVPLVLGAPLPANATRPIESASVRELLEVIEDLDEVTDALVSSFQIDASGSVTLYTVPAGGRSAVTVRLGRRDFEEKFVRLHAFWEQAVLSRPELTFDFIDLRFDSQIVTRES